jgi:hypothetical protein
VVSTVSRSVFCAALFSKACDVIERKYFELAQYGVAGLSWRVFPEYARTVPEFKGGDPFGCVTVRLPPSMSNREFKATARSLASNLHFLQRRAKCDARSWILYFAEKQALKPKLLNNPNGLKEALLQEGWREEDDRFYCRDPCFVLICPRDIKDGLQPVFVEMLDAWKLRQSEDAVMLRSLAKETCWKTCH